jgi:predicted nucleic acid-binding protein
MAYHIACFADAVIAATAIHYQIQLYSYNQKYFKFLPEIKLM